LINENYIDCIDSEIDKRAYIYFPVLETRNSKLFLSLKGIMAQERKIVITDSASYPNKQYIISKIEEILHYSSDKDLSVEIVNKGGSRGSILWKSGRLFYFELNDSSLPVQSRIYWQLIFRR
jgi:hypothetical protein